MWISSFLCIILSNYPYCGTKRLIYPLTQFFLSGNMTAVSSDKLDTFRNPIYWATFVQQWLSELCCIISRQVATSFSSALTADESTPLHHAVTTVHTRLVVATLSEQQGADMCLKFINTICNTPVPTAQWTRLSPVGSNHCAKPSEVICFPWLAFYLNYEKMWHFCSTCWWLREWFHLPTLIPNSFIH